MLRFLKFGDELINPDLIVAAEFKKPDADGAGCELVIDFAAPAFEARPIEHSSCYRKSFFDEDAKIIYAHLCKEAVELTPRRKRDAG
jgi:hypothetical protein